MRNLGRGILAALVVTFVSSASWAGGTHKDDHYSFGEPGRAEDVTRTVAVVADDHGNMRFEMDLAAIGLGEVIRFVVTNEGLEEHEFSVGDTASQRAHAKLMAKNPHMKHENDPTTVVLAPGQTKELIWTFNKPVQGNIVFACQMPGHYRDGMVHEAKLEKAKRAKTS